MSEIGRDRFRVDGIPELWFQPAERSPGRSRFDSARLVYRPSVFIECTLNYRSLRAGLSHSEDNSYAAWLPEGDSAIDWDLPVVEVDSGVLISTAPQAGAADFYP